MSFNLEKRQKNGLVYYTAPLFERYGAVNMFTTRAGGVSDGVYASLNFRRAEDENPDNIRKNYVIAANALNKNAESIVCTKQVHGNIVTEAKISDAGIGFSKAAEWETDALVTCERGLTLVGFYADCLLLQFFDPVKRAVGTAHAGWRGTSLDISVRTVEKMTYLYGSSAENIMVALSPCICKNCYETDDNVAQDMFKNFGSSVAPYIERRGDKWFVDIAGINILRLLSCGIKPENIIAAALCTKCSGSEFWSHRATNGIRGVHAGFIALN